MIAGMMRALTGLAAWLAGTTLAVCLAWFGAGMVVRSTGMSPGVPVISAVSAQPTQQAQPASPAGGTPTTPTTPTATGPRTTARGPGPSPSATRRQSPAPTVRATAAAGTTPAAAGTTHGYTLTGGHVTLLATQGTVELVSAVPDPGYAVQNWSGTGWLRVDFSSGTQVSSLIASWFEHPLSVTITN
jgi:hypothetical protein